MGAVSGAFAAAATTPLDVIKTRMMCTAATRPSMRSAAAKVWAQVCRGERVLLGSVGVGLIHAWFSLSRVLQVH